jgi:hypothetical protein
MNVYVADANRIQLACSRQAGLHNSLAQWVREKQQSFLEAKGAKQHAAGRVVFHFLSYGELFGETKGELPG